MARFLWKEILARNPPGDRVGVDMKAALLSTFAGSLACAVLAGCGSASVPETEVATEVGEDTGAGHVAPEVEAEQPAVEEPAEPQRHVMEGRELDGPFGSPRRACRWLKKKQIGSCIEGTDGWNTGEYEGKRGGLRGARTLSVTIRVEKGASYEEACALLIETGRGWWLHGKRDACRTRDVLARAGESFQTSLVRIDHADDLGEGVLVVEREGTRRLFRREIEDGEEQLTGFWGRQREVMYCAARPEGAPRCSEWHVVGCESSERVVEHRDGEIVVTRPGPDDPVCAERMMKPGSYTPIVEERAERIDEP
jgi:hypothetical protein